MAAFEPIWERAIARHGEAALVGRFPTVHPPEVLRAIPDDRALSAIAWRLFAAGFRMRVIEAKWDGFEEAFHAFDPAWVAGLDDDGVAALAADTRIVRNRPKILSTVANAAYVLRIAKAHGSFGAWLADWPDDDVVRLWAAMKRDGDRLGGDTGPWILRRLGKDTFRLTDDVVAALIEAGVVDKAPTSKRALATVQDQVNTWATATGLTRGAISTVLASSTGPVYAR